jgi:hypothetical protein
MFIHVIFPEYILAGASGSVVECLPSRHKANCFCSAGFDPQHCKNKQKKKLNIFGLLLIESTAVEPKSTEG